MIRTTPTRLNATRDDIAEYEIYLKQLKQLQQMEKQKNLATASSSSSSSSSNFNNIQDPKARQKAKQEEMDARIGVSVKSNETVKKGDLLH